MRKKIIIVLFLIVYLLTVHSYAEFDGFADPSDYDTEQELMSAYEELYAEYEEATSLNGDYKSKIEELNTEIEQLQTQIYNCTYEEEHEWDYYLLYFLGLLLISYIIFIIFLYIIQSNIETLDITTDKKYKKMRFYLYIAIVILIFVLTMHGL